MSNLQYYYQPTLQVPTDCESTGIGIGTLDVQSSVLLSTDVTGEWSWSGT